MKGKMTIVLLSLVLVFGMIAASCDDGAFPDNPYTNNPNKRATDWKRSPMSPAVPKEVGKLSTILSAIGIGTIKDDTAGKGKIAGTPIQFVGNSELTINAAGAVTIESKDSWGGGLDIKIGSGADQIPLKGGDTIKITTGALTGSWVLRLKTDDYNGGSDTKLEANKDLTYTLTEGDIGKIAAGNGCIRVNTSATGNSITVTDIVLTTYFYGD